MSAEAGSRLLVETSSRRTHPDSDMNDTIVLYFVLFCIVSFCCIILLILSSLNLLLGMILYLILTHQPHYTGLYYSSIGMRGANYMYSVYYSTRSSNARVRCCYSLLQYSVCSMLNVFYRCLEPVKNKNNRVP